LMDLWNSVASDNIYGDGDWMFVAIAYVVWNDLMPNETSHCHVLNAVLFRVNHKFTSGVLASINHRLSKTMFLRNMGGSYRLCVDLYHPQQLLYRCKVLYHMDFNQFIDGKYPEAWEIKSDFGFSKEVEDMVKDILECQDFNWRVWLDVGCHSGWTRMIFYISTGKVIVA
jgi:hypothetical protein